MEFKVLGPLEVRSEGQEVRIAGGKQRALLALLLLHANETVSSERLIDGLWGDTPPESGTGALQVRISQLRKALDPGAKLNGAGPLQTRPSGYMLQVAPDDLDLARFDGCCGRASLALAAGNLEEGSQLLRQAIELWRGPALADLAGEPFVQPAAALLDDRRADALERWFDAELSLGHHADLVAKLNAAVDEHPLRERFTAQLMVALYRCGRQADALAAYRRTAEHLQGELGIEPGEELLRTHVAVLRHDPSLDLRELEGEPAKATGRPAPASVGVPTSEITHPRPAGRRRAALAAALVLMTVASLLVWGSRRSPASVSLDQLPTDALGVVDEASGRVVGSVPLPAAPTAMVSGSGALWMSNFQAGSVDEIDPATQTVRQTIAVGAGPSGMAAGAGAIWVADTLDGTVTRIDPLSRRVVHTITGVGLRPGPLAFGAGHVWVAGTLSATLAEIDPASQRVVHTIPLDASASAIAFGGGQVWVATPAGGLQGVDPTSLKVITNVLNVGLGANSVAYADGAVWVANTLDGTVSRIDPQRETVTDKIPVGQGPLGLAATAEGVWVTSGLGGSMSWIDGSSESVRTIPLGNHPGAIAVVGDRVWVGVDALASEHRGGTLRLRSHSPFETLDPATAPIRGWVGTAALQLTNDGLVAFNRSSAVGGAPLVPDLAVSLPTPSDGGRTYVFRVRSDVRYSTGATVLPSDFVGAFERDFRLGDAGAAYYADLLGAQACMDDPSRCDLSAGIVADDAAGTLTFHLVAPNPDFLATLALVPAVAVPATTPFGHEVGMDPIGDPVPATGPYVIQRVSRAGAVMVRNPFFHEWSATARPDGFADRIVWHFGGDPAAGVDAIEQGRADWSFDRPPLERMPEIQTRYSSQLQLTPSDAVVSLSFNPPAGPFRSPSVRRALNMAIDRAEVVRLIGDAGRPTCQMLPPGVPGYRSYCPFFTSGSASSGPDLARARRMVAASGMARARIVVDASPVPQTDVSRLAAYVARVLDSLGFRARVAPAEATIDPSVPQVSFYDWVADYPAPSDFIGPLFGCGGAAPSVMDITGFCYPWLGSLTARAQASSTDQPTFDRRWAAIDRRVTDESPVVALYNPIEIDFVGARVGNFRADPQLGVLLDQLWVR